MAHFICVSQLYRYRYSCDMVEMTYRQIVREIAIDSYGYVTTTQAVAAGVPAIELPKLAARGGLDHVAYGLYRVPDLPSTAYDQFAEALSFVAYSLAPQVILPLPLITYIRFWQMENMETLMNGMPCYVEYFLIGAPTFFRALDMAITSARVLTGDCGWATRMSVASPILPTDVKSLSVSKGSLANT